MKSRTSITLSHDILCELDRSVGRESRSVFIERVLRGYFRRRERAAINARDRGRIDRAAKQLNAEAEDVLEYRS